LKNNRQNHTSVNISRLDENSLDDWDGYVNSHPHGTICHLSSWRGLLETVYGLTTCYLLARDAGQVVGVLPMARVKSLLFGHTLVSTPFCVYGGVLADSDEVLAALTAGAIRIGHELNVDYIEFREVLPSVNDWPAKDFYFRFNKPIQTEAAANMQAVPRKQRAMIRKGINNGLVSVEDDGIDRFYDIYAVSVRNLGTPVYPKNYFRALKAVFGDRCRILTVTKDQKPVASVLSLYYHDTVMPYYGGGLAVARTLKAYDFMYWELMRRSCEQGLRRFDFGRSIKGTGSYSFKKNWGFEPEPLYYKQYMIKAGTSPDFSPANPRYEKYIRVWQKLPLPLANFIGPYIARHLG
jgi:FemAB-related protein (PEP-CTERM system-associated)